jgi:acyl-CoA dehydrogenase
MFLVDPADPAIRTLRVLDTIDSSMPGGHATLADNLHPQSPKLPPAREMFHLG